MSECAAKVLIFALVVIAGQARAQENGLPYEVIDGRVDQATYRGYQRFHAFCHTCHGPDGIGSSYGPALSDSLQDLDHATFVNVVGNGRDSDQGLMPSFGQVDEVMDHLDDIYAYLKARSDGVLGPGEPEQHDD